MYMYVLQGARMVYERESTIDIDYSDLEEKFKKVLEATNGIVTIPLWNCAHFPLGT